MQDIVISVSELCKNYKIYDNPIDRLKEAIHPLKKVYHKEFFALKNVNFEISRGDTVGIVGKNGSGKSTLLKIITGVLTPSSGIVDVKGKIAALLELGAGFNPEMTGIENVYLTGTLMGYSKEEIKERIDAIIEFADIGDFIFQPVKTYSSGMFARLAFSVNVNVEPDILIVDEALSVGDMFFQQKCLHKMKKMQENGTTIFFVSHAISTVKALCNKAIYLKNGKLIDIGETERVCTLYQNEMNENDSACFQNEFDNLEKKYNAFIARSDFGGFEKYFRVDNNLDARITERSGGGELKVTSFDIFDENEQIINLIEVFKPITLRVSIIVEKNIPAGAAVGILCRTDLGIDIFGCNSNIEDFYLPAMVKGEKFVYELKIKTPLLAGIYWFHIGIKPNPELPYWYERCFSVNYLEIINDDRLKEKPIGGLIYIKDHQIKLYSRRSC